MIRKLEYSLWYLWGFSCLFFVPYVQLGPIQVRFVELTTITLIFFSMLSWTLTKPESLSERHLLGPFVSVILLLTFGMLWPLAGVINVQLRGYDPNVNSFIAPIRRAAILLFLLITSLMAGRQKWAHIREALYKGFLHASVFAALWMFLEQGFYLLRGQFLNDLVFRQIMGIYPGHTFVNLIGSVYTHLPVPLYRSVGFGWDPGPSGVLVSLAWFLYVLSPRRLVGRKRISVSVLLLSAAVITLSRTTIFALAGGISVLFGGYLVGTILRTSVARKPFSELSKNSEIKFVFSSIISALMVLVAIGALFAWNLRISPGEIVSGVESFVTSTLQAGEQRHIGYYGLIVPAMESSWPSLFLGYGTANVGVGMEAVGVGILPGLEREAEMRKGNWNPESSLVVFALMGGLPTLIALGISFLVSLGKGILDYLRFVDRTSMLYPIVIMAFVIITFAGYGSASTMMYIIVFLLFAQIWGRSEYPR